MADELGPDGRSASGKRDGVAVTTEVEIRERVCGGAGEDRRPKIQLRTNIFLVLEVSKGMYCRCARFRIACGEGLARGLPRHDPNAPSQCVIVRPT